LRVDVAVVGAGPAGLLAAMEASRRGAEVLVLEEHGEVGVPDHCAGLISLAGLKALGLEPGGYVRSRVRGARIYSPSCLRLDVEADGPVAVVVDRELLDKALAREAERAGATLMLRARAVRVRREGGLMVVEAEAPSGRLEVKAKVLIDAEGARFKVSRQLGLPQPDASLLYPALQAEVEGAHLEEDRVEVYLGSSWAPGFFAWMVPSGERVKVGLAARGVGLSRALRRLMERHPVASRRLEGARTVRLMGGLLVLSGPLPKVHVEGAMAVGDAACHAKPTTGGGVVFGGVAARIAGAEASRAARGDEGAYARYEARWRGLLERELRWMRALRLGLSAMSDAELDRLFALATRLEVGRALSRLGDMDFHAHTLRALMSTPRAAPLAAWLGLRAAGASTLRG